MTDTIPTPEQPTPDQTEQEVQPVPVPPLPYTAKADTAEYRKRIGWWRIALALLLTGVFFARFGFLVWLLSTIGIAGIIVIVLVVLSRHTITFNSADFVHVNGFGRRRTFAYSDIEGAKAFVNFIEPGFGMLPRLTVAPKSGEAPLTLSSLYWPPEEMDKIIAIFQEKKVPTEFYVDPATSAMIAKQFPNYTSYMERHPLKIAVIATLAVIAFSVAAAFVMLWLFA